MIKNVIFDLGGVLIDWDPKYMYRKIFDTEEEIDQFLATICTFEWNEEQDGGRTIAEANQILIDKFPQWEKEIKAFYGRWEEMLGDAIQGTVDLLQQIYDDKNYRLYALTNWSAETWPVAVDRFHFLQYFEGILVSGQEKLKKPDPKIYQMILDRYDLNPTECIFIDDNKRNVVAAETEGIASIHFENPEQLSSILKEKGIL